MKGRLSRVILAVMVAAATVVTAAEGATIRFAESIPQQMDLAAPLSTTDAWLDLIASAETSLLIGQFYWTLTEGASLPTHEGWRGTKVWDAVWAAHRRGVAVRILQNEPSASMPQNETAELAAAGVPVLSLDFPKYGVPGIFHTKLLIADGSSFYVGSANMDWRSLAQVKECGVVVSGAPDLVADARAAFESAWLVAKNGAIPSKWPSGVDAIFNLRHQAKVLFDGTKGASEVYMAASPPEFCTPNRTDAIESTLDVINGATKSVNIEVMDYIPSSLYLKPNIYWPVIDDAIRAAAFRGVKVRMLIGLWDHTNPKIKQYMRSLGALDNVEARWFVVPPLQGLQPVPFTRVNHAKFLVTEDIAYITTSNWSQDYFVSTGGLNLVVRNSDVAAQLQSIFDRDWNSKYAQPITSA